MTANESALCALMEELGFSHGMVVTALQILGQDRDAVADALLYLYDNRPTEAEFVEYIADICAGPR